MKLGFRLLAVLGSLAFGMAFALTFATPEFVERTGAHFIKHKIEQETHEKIDSLTLQTSNSRLDKLTQKLLDNQQARITEIKTKIKASADAKIEDVFAQMSDFDCECRAKFSESIRQQLWIDVTLAEAAVAKVEDFLKAKYVDVVRNLRTDLRIFIGSNLAAFLSLLLVSLVKPRAAPQLLVPGMILMCAVVICSYFYIFQQNWFLTIIYSDYVGFAYLAYLGGVFSLLCDVSLNRGRVMADAIFCWRRSARQRRFRAADKGESVGASRPPDSRSRLNLIDGSDIAASPKHCRVTDVGSAASRPREDPIPAD